MPSNNNDRLTHDELSVLCWELAKLNKAGIPWADSAELLLENTDSRRIRLVLEAMRSKMPLGAPLTQVLEETGQFPDYLLHMIKIGEISGRLDQVLEALSLYYKRESALAATIRSAVTYPCVMATLISLIFLILVIRVLPVFSQVFSLLGTGVPPVLLSLMRPDSFGRYLLIGFALLLLAGAILALILFRSERGVKLFSRGAVAACVGRARFSSSMSLMLSSGLPLDEAMERTKVLLSDSPLADAFASCKEKMDSGLSFPKAVSEAGIFTGLEAGMLTMGFRTGNSEAAMNELAERNQEEADLQLNRLLSRFEYALVIILCGSVGLILLSVMLPLLSMLSSIGG